jgi:dolichol-phosphate mannosyltransferase
VDISIIIPCYNESENVPRLRQELWPTCLSLAETRSVEIIFVDDGSRDGTAAALEATFRDASGPAVRIVRHIKNRGLGAALRTGLSAARGDVLVTTDCDGTYAFSEIPALLAQLTPDADIVTASPYHRDGGVDGVPAYRLLLSRGSSLIYRVLVDWRLRTYTSLFRAYRRPVTEKITTESDGFLAVAELLVKAMLAGYRAVEYPTVLHVRRAGVSKARLARTVVAHLRFQARVLGYRLRITDLLAPARTAPAPMVGSVEGVAISRR